MLCDYVTRCLEAVALKPIDAETIPEGLIKILARVGILKEILTDQTPTRCQTCDQPPHHHTLSMLY